MPGAVESKGSEVGQEVRKRPERVCAFSRVCATQTRLIDAKQSHVLLPVGLAETEQAACGAAHQEGAGLQRERKAAQVCVSSGAALRPPGSSCVQLSESARQR